jgi:hypothetical protein
MRGYVDGVKNIVCGSPPFLAGDLVVIDGYYRGHRKGENNIVRRVTKVSRSNCATGWKVDIDGGVPCSCCGLTGGNKLSLASSWLINAVTGYQPGQSKE